MNEAMNFSINSQDVVNETIEGEVIMINMKSGNYYSVDRVGADIWTCLEKGLASADIVDVVAKKYAVDADTVKDEVDRFLSELNAENLLCPAESSASADGFALEPAGEGDSFQAPSLDKYDDLQDLLLADPIHDVDAGGWPNNPEA
ncbi:MAG: PqqD family protein [Verrucomicrobia bacterium]|nr:PqqD family protein [Verrucomicrobiota bacterium]